MGDFYQCSAVLLFGIAYCLKNCIFAKLKAMRVKSLNIQVKIKLLTALPTGKKQNIKMNKNIKKTDALPKQQVKSKLYKDVCSLIENTRRRLATTINAEACILHWQIGKCIKEDVLLNKRADYGKQVIKNLAIALTEKYGKGWGYEKLKHWVRSEYSINVDTFAVVDEH